MPKWIEEWIGELVARMVAKSKEKQTRKTPVYIDDVRNGLKDE